MSSVRYPDVWLAPSDNKVHALIPIKKSEADIVVSEYISILSLVKNMDTGFFRVDLEFLAPDGCIEVVQVDRDVLLDPNKITQLHNIGVDVRIDKVKYLIQHLSNEECIAPTRYIHESLGFATLNGNTFFKHKELIGSTIESEYEGRLEIGPAGSRQKWLDMFNKEVIGHAPLEFGVVASLSSSVNAFIANEVGSDTIIIHNNGYSSTGKSTWLSLVISLYGYPFSSKTGLFANFNATQNALIKTLAGLIGIPVAFDELSMFNSKNPDSFVYQMVTGAEKARLNRQASFQEKATWLTTILTNGEIPIAKESSNAGIQARVFEINDMQCTRNAGNAERIKSCINDNYGWIGPEFVDYILKYGKEAVISLYYKKHEEMKQLFRVKGISDSIVDRRLIKYGILLATTELFQSFMNVSLQINEIKQILVGIERDSILKRNYKETVIEYLKSFLSINAKRFEIIDKRPNGLSSSGSNGEQYGRMIIRESEIEIEFNENSFFDCLSKGGYENSRTVLNELKKSGYLDYEKDKTYRKRKDGLGIIRKVYVLKFNDFILKSQLDSLERMILRQLDEAIKKKLLIEKKRLIDLNKANN